MHESLRQMYCSPPNQTWPELMMKYEYKIVFLTTCLAFSLLQKTYHHKRSNEPRYLHCESLENSSSWISSLRMTKISTKSPFYTFRSALHPIVAKCEIKGYTCSVEGILRVCPFHGRPKELESHARKISQMVQKYLQVNFKDTFSPVPRNFWSSA